MRKIPRKIQKATLPAGNDEIYDSLDECDDALCSPSTWSGRTRLVHVKEDACNHFTDSLFDDLSSRQTWHPGYNTIDLAHSRNTFSHYTTTITSADAWFTDGCRPQVVQQEVSLNGVDSGTIYRIAGTLRDPASVGFRCSMCISADHNLCQSCTQQAERVASRAQPAVSISIASTPTRQPVWNEVAHMPRSSIQLKFSRKSKAIPIVDPIKAKSAPQVSARGEDTTPFRAPESAFATSFSTVRRMPCKADRAVLIVDPTKLTSTQ